MGMIGNPANSSFQRVANDSFNGDGSTTVFTLSAEVAANTDIEVLVDNVQQSPYDGSYTASGTTLTFSAAPQSGTNNIYIIYNIGHTFVTNTVGSDNIQDGAVSANKIASGVIKTPEEAMTTPFGRRNILINAGFQISQRGDFTTASSSTNGAYFVDRWLSAQDVITANKQHLYNQTITPSITANTLKIIATSSGTGNFQISQPIERVNQDLGNKTLTYSVWVKTNNSNVRLRGIFDDSGWTQFNAVHTGDGTWQKLSTTFTTGPTRSAGHYQVQVLAYDGGNVSISSGDYIEIAQPQVEIGSVATPFEHRSYGEELALCQRYYTYFPQGFTHNGGASAITTWSYSSGGCSTRIYPSATTMRAQPTAVLYGQAAWNGSTPLSIGSDGTYGIYSNGNWANISSYTGVTEPTADPTVRFDAQFSTTGGHASGLYFYNADNAKPGDTGFAGITLDAEL